jgi:hypothetical protein
VKRLNEVLNPPPKLVLNESSLARIHEHTQNRHIGIFSAQRGEHSAQENERADAALRDDARKHGLGFVRMHGAYTEDKGGPNERQVHERSIMVFGHKEGDDNGHLKGFLLKHGQKYKQDSVLYKPHNEKNAHLIGTKEGAWPGKGEKHDLGPWHPNRTPEFHSVLRHPKSGKTFAFEEFRFVNEVSFSSRKETEFV